MSNLPRRTAIAVGFLVLGVMSCRVNTESDRQERGQTHSSDRGLGEEDETIEQFARRLSAKLPVPPAPLSAMDKVKQGVSLAECVEFLGSRGVHLFTIVRQRKEYVLIEFFLQAPGGKEIGEIGGVCHALFTDRRFSHFVEPPRIPTETVDYQGTPMTRVVPWGVGDESRIDAYLSPKLAVDKTSIERRIRIYSDAQVLRRSENPLQGLIWGNVIMSNTQYRLQLVQSYKENLSLWKQYDPLQIEVGVGRVEVERLLGKEVGGVGDAAGRVRLSIYGPSRVPTVGHFFRFRRIGVLYRDDRVRSVYGEDMFSPDWMEAAGVH